MAMDLGFKFSVSMWSKRLRYDHGRLSRQWNLGRNHYPGAPFSDSEDPRGDNGTFDWDCDGDDEEYEYDEPSEDCGGTLVHRVEQVGRVVTQDVDRRRD